jgi:sugar/nucleoside kinase (ribokinase family)
MPDHDDDAVEETRAANGVAAPHILVLGDVIDDIIVRPHGAVRPDTDTNADIERRAGGSAANAAAWFAHLGFSTDFVGRVGESDLARHSDILSRSGVTPHLIGQPDRPTGTIVIIVDDAGGRTMLTERGANALTSARDVDRTLLASAAHLHVTGYTVFNDTGPVGIAEFAALIADARALGASVSVNPGSSGFIADHGADALFAATAGSTVAITNLDEGRALTGLDDADSIVTALLEHYETVALTLGRHGVLAGARGMDAVLVPARHVASVDPTGAGDAFSAGFVTGLLRSGPLLDGSITSARLRGAATVGAETAATAVTRVGARPAGSA